MDRASRTHIITVYSENQIGLLCSISGIFARRNIDIDSLTVFPSEFPGIYRFTFRLSVNEETAERLVRIIEKNVEVLKAFCFRSNEVWDSEHETVAAYLREHMNKNQ